MKKAFLVGFAIVALLIFLTVAYMPRPVRAEFAESIGLNSGATLFSPVNATYSSRFLTLNLTLGAGLGVQYSFNYSLDGKYQSSIHLVAQSPTQMHVINTMIGSVELPELSEGSHYLTITEVSGIYDYHGANAPGAPFKQFPGSPDYVASWTHTVYFTINSPSPPSPSPTPTLTHSATPSPSPSITPTQAPSPTPTLTPPSSPTQQPTREPSLTPTAAPIHYDIHVETYYMLEFGIVLVIAVVIALLVYLKKIKK